MSNQKYVTTHGPVPEYLTAGKVYPIVDVDLDGEHWIQDDEGCWRCMDENLRRRSTQFHFCDEHGNPVQEHAPVQPFDALRNLLERV